MNFFKMIGDAMQFVSEGVGRVFSPTDDKYPETGVQPFDGEPSSSEEKFPTIKTRNK